jgi:hypothetical protein
MNRQTKGEGFEYQLEDIADEYELKPNPIPGPKLQANFGVMRLPYLCGASKDVLHCLVEPAHALGVRVPLQAIYSTMDSADAPVSRPSASQAQTLRTNAAYHAAGCL